MNKFNELLKLYEDDDKQNFVIQLQFCELLYLTMLAQRFLHHRRKVELELNRHDKSEDERSKLRSDRRKLSTYRKLTLTEISKRQMKLF